MPVTFNHDHGELRWPGPLACDWPGEGQVVHRFHVYAPATPFIRAQGVYIFAAQIGRTVRFQPLYVGETDDLRRCVEAHRAAPDLWRAAEERGFDSIHVLYEHDGARRRAIHDELARALCPALNDTGSVVALKGARATGSLPGSLW